MSLAYIAQYYNVPARRGQRVEHTNSANVARQGVIVSAKDQYLRIRFDGDKKRFPGVFHPTDNMRYLTTTPKA
jgi:hypothetical protein